MRISTETRIATVRYCVSKLPLLLLLLLLAPSITKPSSESTDTSIGTEATVAASKVPPRPQRVVPGLAQPQFPPRSQQIRQSHAKKVERPGAAAVSDRKEAVSPANDLKEWVATQEHEVAGLFTELEQQKESSLSAKRAELSTVNNAIAVHRPTEPQHEPNLTPLRHTLLAFLIIWLAVRPLVFTLDESLTHSLLANPLPAVSYSTDERDNRSGCTRVGTWSPRRGAKVLAEVRWRVRNISTSGGRAVLGLAFVTILLAVGLAFDPFVSAKIAPTEIGWNAVTGRWISSRPIRLAPGPAATLAGARGWTPLRNLVWLETLSAFACALHGLSPLLLHLGILRPKLSARFLLPPIPASPSPQDHSLRFSPHMPTAHLVSTLYLPLLTRFVTLLQALQLLLARPPAYRWFSLSTVALFLAVTVPLDSMVVVRQRAAREAERLVEVAATFGDEATTALDRSALDEHDWICSVCLRDSFDAIRALSPSRSTPTETAMQIATFDSRCRLPCGHRFHAYCLSTWFTSLSACPTCHRTVTRPSLPLSSSVPLVAEPAATASAPFFAEDAAAAEQAQQAAIAAAELNQYPGAAALRRREAERQRTVKLPAEMTEVGEREADGASPLTHV